MYFSLKTDCYFRRYDTIGHIVRPVVSTEEVVDEVGAIFIEQLKYEPQEIDIIVDNLKDVFCDVEFSELKNDALEFYQGLVADGFLNASETLQTFNNVGFEYSTLNGKLAHKTFKTQLEESSSHFLGEYFKEHPFLETFHIELTSKCNERCVHCYIPHEKKDADIEYNLMIRALNQCKDLGVLTVIFSGGEPMLHPDFCKFLRYAKDLDFNVTILSNLTVLTDDILSALTYRHDSCVNVSLYSMDSKVHDAITTIKGSFEKTKRNILKLIDNNVPVQINCPIMKQNRDSFYEVVKWGQNHKCSVITDYLIMARCDRSTDNLDNRLTSEDIAFVVETLIENDIVFQTNVKRGKVNKEALLAINPEDRVCGVGMTTLCMVANGSVYPCAGWQRYTCGNLNTESLKQIWEDSPQIKYLRNLRQKDFGKCLECEDFDFCMMCMSRNSNEDPDGNIFNIPKITCDAARIHRKVVERYRAENAER